MQDFTEKNADLLYPSANRGLTMTERAEQKFKTEDAKDDAVKAQIDEAMENPISHYYAEKHPEIVSDAQERQYQTESTPAE